MELPATGVVVVLRYFEILPHKVWIYVSGREGRVAGDVSKAFASIGIRLQISAVLLSPFDGWRLCSKTDGNGSWTILNWKGTRKVLCLNWLTPTTGIVVCGIY